MPHPATVSELWIYPVKSLRGGRVPGARLEPWGFDGDRRWMAVDADGRFVTQRSTPAMSLVHATRRRDGLVELSSARAAPVVLRPVGPPTTVEVWRDTVAAVGATPEADRWLSRELEREVRLVHMAHPAVDRAIDPDYAAPGEPVTFADGYPLLVVNRASLAALNDWQEAAGARAMTTERFRPSLVIDADEPWAEDGWERIAVGPVELRLVKPCSRCVITAVVPETGTIEKGGPLRRLGVHRTGVAFGVNAIPATTGTLRVGDAVRVVAEREPTRVDSEG